MSQEVDTYTYSDPARLTNWTKWLLYVQFGLLLANLVWSLSELRMVMEWRQNAGITSSQMLTALEANRDRHRVLRGAEIVAIVTAAVLTLIWIYRANKNCHGLGALGLKFTPDWAVAWFFVPLANLWKPLQMMMEVWKASGDPKDWHYFPLGAIVYWWWGLFLAASATLPLPLFLVLTLKRGIVPAFVFSSMLSRLTLALLCLVTAIMIGRIAEMQIAHRADDPQEEL